MIQITFIRHGQSEANIFRVMSGHSLTPLSEFGKEELLKLKKKNFYPEVDLVFCSDLPRAIETAQILYPQQEHEKLELLRETNFGPYENKPVSEVMEEFYGFFLKDEVKGEMESYQTLKERVEQALQSIVESMKQHNVNTASVISHNGFLRMMYHLFKPSSIENYRDFYCENGHGFTITFDAYLQAQVLKPLD